LDPNTQPKKPDANADIVAALMRALSGKQQDDKPKVERDVIPEGTPLPDDASAAIKAALESERGFLLCERGSIERIGSKPRLIDRALRKAIGDERKLKANIVTRIYPARMRAGDLIVVAVPHSDFPFSDKHLRLQGPIEVSRFWNASAEGGGAASAPELISAVARAIAPYTIARRAEPENAFFEVRPA